MEVPYVKRTIPIQQGLVVFDLLAFFQYDLTCQASAGTAL